MCGFMYAGLVEMVSVEDIPLLEKYLPLLDYALKMKQVSEYLPLLAGQLSWLCYLQLCKSFHHRDYVLHMKTHSYYKNRWAKGIKIYTYRIVCLKILRSFRVVFSVFDFL